MGRYMQDILWQCPLTALLGCCLCPVILRIATTCPGMHWGVAVARRAACLTGDSRAVLCRGDVAMPLTDDHKAAREDEVVRHAPTPLCPSCTCAACSAAPADQLPAPLEYSNCCMSCVLVLQCILSHRVCRRESRLWEARSCTGMECVSWGCWLCHAQWVTTACGPTSLLSQRCRPRHAPAARTYCSCGQTDRLSLRIAWSCQRRATPLTGH